MNPSTRLPDYINLTSSIRLQPDDYRTKTITNYNQYHIHTHIHIQLHIHNHIFTMNLCDFITFLQSNFDINQSTKNDLIQTMTAYIKHDINKRQDTNAQSIAHTDSKRSAILIYIWGEIFLAYNARIYMGAVSDWQ